MITRSTVKPLKVRQAIVRDRWRYTGRIADALVAASVIPAAVVGLWLLLRIETGWAITLITVAVLCVVRTSWRLMDPQATPTGEQP